MKQKVLILTEGAVAIALAVVFSYIKIWHMPQGGSVTLENVPLLVFAFRRGGRPGIMAGILAGALQLLLGGYVVHPLQALFDYPLAFGSLGLAGFFRVKSLVPGTIVSGVVRLLCHVLSGVIFFSSYAPEGTPAWLYSLLYNGTFLLPSFILAFVILMTLKKQLIFKGDIIQP
ncbi:MAG TPA: energy-coupled thiamine transporter ThiT [Firmicutes bacterium]|nr:energy-coupled thiamine transporter ThiT [Bacillota bacterium]